jgi:hypothetical protein
MYNDKSVLENHHCTLTFELLEETGLIGHFKGDEFKEFRRTIISCILGTDMTKHNKFLKKFTEFDTEKEEFSTDEQSLICCIFLHCADLSSSIKQFNVCFEWSKRISQEFYEQAIKEEIEGLPSLPFMKINDNITMCMNEINFITNITIPMWELFVHKFPDLQFIIDRCNDNLSKWKEFHAVLISNNYLDSLNYLLFI